MPINTNVKELVQQPIIPVYGVADSFLGLMLTSIGKSFRGGDTDEKQILTTITLGFSGKHTGLATSLNLHSSNSGDRETRNQFLKMLQPHPHPHMSMDNRTLRLFQFDEDARKYIGQPTKRVEQITLINHHLFTLETHHWSLPPQPAWFLLQNKDELFFGDALGFTKDELFQVLQQCAIVNNREQTLHLYQQELDQHIKSIRDELRRDDTA